MATVSRANPLSPAHLLDRLALGWTPVRRVSRDARESISTPAALEHLRWLDSRNRPAFSSRWCAWPARRSFLFWNFVDTRYSGAIPSVTSRTGAGRPRSSATDAVSSRFVIGRSSVTAASLSPATTVAPIRRFAGWVAVSQSTEVFSSRRDGDDNGHCDWPLLVPCWRRQSSDPIAVPTSSLSISSRRSVDRWRRRARRSDRRVSRVSVRRRRPTPDLRTATLRLKVTLSIAIPLSPTSFPGTASEPLGFAALLRSDTAGGNRPWSAPPCPRGVPAFKRSDYSDPLGAILWRRTVAASSYRAREWSDLVEMRRSGNVFYPSVAAPVFPFDAMACGCSTPGPTSRLPCSAIANGRFWILCVWGSGRSSSSTSSGTLRA